MYRFYAMFLLALVGLIPSSWALRGLLLKGHYERCVGCITGGVMDFLSVANLERWTDIFEPEEACDQDTGDYNRSLIRQYTSVRPSFSFDFSSIPEFEKEKSNFGIFSARCNELYEKLEKTRQGTRKLFEAFEKAHPEDYQEYFAHQIDIFSQGDKEDVMKQAGIVLLYEKTKEEFEKELKEIAENRRSFRRAELEPLPVVVPQKAKETRSEPEMPSFVKRPRSDLDPDGRPYVLGH